MAKVAKSKKIQFWGTGRRKKSVARVRLLPAGSGNITIRKSSFLPEGSVEAAMS